MSERHEHGAGARSPRRVDHRRALGQLGERLAVAHLEQRGYAILARNVRTRHGEIDVVAFDRRRSTVVFVEVKTRRTRCRATLDPDHRPLAGLHRRQRVRLRRLAAAWLQREHAGRPYAHAIRFDAVGVTVDDADRTVGLDHLEGAW